MFCLYYLLTIHVWHLCGVASLPPTTISRLKLGQLPLAAMACTLSHVTGPVSNFLYCLFNPYNSS